MISSRELKYYSSLLIKKYRVEENKFLVEGKKIVEDGLASNFNCEAIFATQAFIDSEPEIINTAQRKSSKFYQIKSAEFQRLSDTRSPQGIAAVFSPRKASKNISDLKENMLILIDNISDPGNLGTILRTCDWFGFNFVLISKYSVEYLNPKVIRSSMGSIFHLNIFQDVNENDLSVLKENGYKFITTDLDGESIYKFKLPDKSIISFSNESSGPGEMLQKYSAHKITIPKIGKAESLNVASAAAIILSKLTNNKK